jgi:hypothetical protein
MQTFGKSEFQPPGKIRLFSNEHYFRRFVHRLMEELLGRPTKGTAVSAGLAAPVDVSTGEV